jgi:Predicted AAA-ATPase
VNDVTFGNDPEKQLQYITDIERFFGTSLFSTLKEACVNSDTGCVSKFFVTGVLPAFHEGIKPLLANPTISGRVLFRGACGLTKYQAWKIASIFLRRFGPGSWVRKVCRTMKYYYYGYYFAENSGFEEHLYNPHDVNDYLYGYEEGGRVHVPGQARSVHLERVLHLIPDTGNFSMEDIMGLLANGYIESEVRDIFGSIELGKVGKDKATTLSFLMYSGALTRDVDSGILRIPNKAVENMVYISPFRSVDFWG